MARQRLLVARRAVVAERRRGLQLERHMLEPGPPRRLGPGCNAPLPPRAQGSSWCWNLHVEGGLGAMRDALAERLLANVMEWTPEDVAEQRPILQALAAFKYDEYQQFSPGMRFVESLALWLQQFQMLDERKAAYAFVLSRLVFLSHAEMAHFSAIAYPDVIRPVFIEQAARDAEIAPFRVSQVLGTDAFKRLQGASLFFGLSDGARIDLFRRSNKELSHEQIFT